MLVADYHCGHQNQFGHVIPHYISLRPSNPMEYGFNMGLIWFPTSMSMDSYHQSNYIILRESNVASWKIRLGLSIGKLSAPAMFESRSIPMIIMIDSECPMI